MVIREQVRHSSQLLERHGVVVRHRNSGGMGQGWRGITDRSDAGWVGPGFMVGGWCKDPSFPQVSRQLTDMFGI